MATTGTAIRPIPVRNTGSSIVRGVVLLGVLIGAIALGNWGYSQLNQPQVVTAPGQPTPVIRRNIVATVTGSGVVGSQATSKVNFRQNGVLESVNVQVGQRVQAGEVLAKLVTTDLEFTVRNREVELSNAETRLAALFREPTAADIQAANTSVVAAQTSLATAQANLARALQDRDLLFNPPTTQELTAARADLEQKRADLVQAQSNYDKVAWRPDIGIQPEATALHRATIAYETSRANFELRTAPPSQDKIDNAERAIESARLSIQRAQADLASATARRNQLFQGPNETDIRLQENAVAAARNNLEQARNNLEQATLRAPIAGSVSEIRFQPGETTQGHLLTIVDLDKLKVDVNVDETNVARLRVGQRAQVTFDALQGYSLSGVVAAIAPAAVTTQGVSAFPVTINLDPGQNVRPGMNATVIVTTESKQNVLSVPNRALRTQGRQRTVQVVLPDGTRETRVVQVGIANDQFTEIVSGLQEGEQVFVSTAVTTQQRTNVPGQFGGAGGGFPIPK